MRQDGTPKGTGAPGAESIDCARAALARWQELAVGKGDRKTRRGKIYNGSFGKSRPKDPTKKKKTAAKAKSPASGSGSRTSARK